MYLLRTRLIFSSACAFGFILALSPAIVFAAHCTVAKIAVVAGPWESSAAKKSLAVQAQDSAGVACHAAETLRLSFESTGPGTFTGQTGSAIQAWISTGSANRNFYYQNTSGANHTLTITAGYGTADSWSVSWQATYDTATNLSPEGGGDSPDTSGTTNTTGTQGQGSLIATATGTSEKGTGALAEPRVFENDPLTLTLGHPKRVSVGQPVQFAATPVGLEAAELRTVRYAWSFGDGATSTERTPTHVYEHAGSYVVVGVATRKGHEIAVRTEIIVAPLAVTLLTDEAGRLVIRNDATEESEISGLVISDGTRSFTMPDHTYLLPKASITLFHALSGLDTAPSAAVVYDRKGEIVVEYPPRKATRLLAYAGSAETESLQVASVSMAPAAPVVAKKPQRIVFPSKNEPSDEPVVGAGEDLHVPPEEIDASSGKLAVAAAHDAVYAGGAETMLPSGAAPWAFAGVLLVGIAALYVHKVV